MYNEIMNRPMFQTPQMREGGGIMAGVAPIRGYAEGDFVGDLAESIRGFGDFLRNPEDSISPELYEALKTMTTEEAFTAAGSGVLGTAAITALMQLHPALRRMKGFKPKAKMTEGDLAAPTPGPRRMGERDIMEPNVASREPGQRVIKQGERFDPRATRTETQAPRSSTTKKMEDSDIAQPNQTAAPKGETKSLGQRVAGTLRKGVGIGALAGGAGYLSQMPIYQDLVERGLISLDDLTGASDLYEEYMPDSIKEIISPTIGGERAEQTEYVKERLPEVATARKEGFPEQPKAPPPPPPDPTFLDMLKGAGTQFKDFLQDPANQYALARASQPREGIAPMNFASDFAVGKEEYKQLEAQRENDTALMRNYQFLKETTDLSDKEIVSRLSNEATARDEFLSLFAAQSKETGGNITAEQIAQLEAITGYTLPEEARVRLGVSAAPSADLP